MAEALQTPMEHLPDEMLLDIFARLDTETLLKVVPAVCRRWRAVHVQTRNVHLDLRFIPPGGALRLHIRDESTAWMLREIVKRLVHMVSQNVSGFASLKDASVVAMAEHCPHLTDVDLTSCRRLLDARVVALAEHCPHLTNVNFSFCKQLTDASLVVLAEHFRT